MTTRTCISSGKFIWLLVPLAALLALSGCTDKKVKAARGPQGTGTSAEPDKVLYDRAVDDIKRSRYDEARLALQTLINTYPDSEYLAKAKLATADSYFKQGGETGLSQAIAQYQDFITFFPFLDEAAYAQMQIAMAHYRGMEKPDRDRNEALEAEGAFQTFLQKYPNSPLFADGQQKLRDVQEVLAEGDYAVAHFYYLRNANRASATRLSELVDRYPLFSQADRANWMLATLYARAERNDVAGQYYARIVKDYPLSPLAADSKAALVKLGVPVPEADPTALARMQQEQQTPRPRERGFLANGFLGRPERALKQAPDVSTAARFGTPTMTPEDTPSGETMNAGGSLAVGIAGSGTAAGANGTGTGAVVETVQPGSAAPTSTPAADSAPAPAATSTPAPDSAPAPAATTTVATPAASNASSGAAPTATATNSTAPAASATADSSADSTAGTTTTAQNTTAKSTNNSSNSSTSKKKKGLRKIIPF